MKNIKEITNIIDQKYSDPSFNINILLEETRHCYSTLYEMFIFNLDLSPHKYLENKRLEMAVKLIFNNNQSLFRICRDTGYSNEKTFRTAFKKRFKKTPNELKKELKNPYLDKALMHNYQKIIWEFNDNYR